MFRRLVFAFCMTILILPAAAFAGSHFSIGLAVDGFFPSNQAMWGEGMVGNEWGKIMYGKEWSTGSDRVQYVGPNRPYMIWGPTLYQSYNWDFGLGLELSEQIQYLHFSPSQDVDVTFDRFMVPIKFTIKYTFLTDQKIRPFLGAGASIIYSISRIGGKDLYDQKRNNDYYEDDTDDFDSGLSEDVNSENKDSGASAFKTDQREFGIDAWYPGIHFLFGTNFYVKEKLAILLVVRYEVMWLESIDAELVEDGDEQWHWEERKFRGDAGGFGLSLGINYDF